MKRKININREKLSSEEIAKRKDFNSLMKGYTVVKKPFWKHWSFISGVSAVVVAVAAVTIMQINKPNENVENKNKDVPQTENKNFTYAPSENPIKTSTCIAPPLEGIDVDYTNYKVDVNKGSDLTYKTGSKIKIPKNAFSDANGNPVKGKVDIRYREFHDAADFFVSGIPMKYDSAGNHYTFESAGMVEMYAFQDGKVLKMAPEKNIEIQMATNTDKGGYNVYNLDTTARNWTFMGKDKIKRDEKPNEPLVKAKKDSAFFTNTNGVVDEYNQAHIAPLQTKADNVQTEIKQIKNDIVKLEDTKPVQPKKADKNKGNFNLDVNPKEFPELSAYNKVMMFELGAENKDFKEDTYTIVWEDIVLTAGKTKGSYNITLTKGKEKRSLIGYPVFTEKDYSQALIKFNKSFADYNTKLTDRKDMEAKKQAEYDKLIADIKLQQENYQKQMIAQQKKQEEEYKKKLESMETSEKVYRVFTISGFGVYNCDSPQSYPKGANVNAYFKADDGTNLKLNNVVYLVDRQRNALFTYQGNPINNFGFNPNSKSIVWSVTLDKKLAVSFDEEVASIQNKTGEATFKMKTYPKEELGSLEKLKALLKIGDGAGL